MQGLTRLSKCMSYPHLRSMTIVWSKEKFFRVTVCPLSIIFSYGKNDLAEGTSTIFLQIVYWIHQNPKHSFIEILSLKYSMNTSHSLCSLQSIYVFSRFYDLDGWIGNWMVQGNYTSSSAVILVTTIRIQHRLLVIPCSCVWQQIGSEY